MVLLKEEKEKLNGILNENFTQSKLISMYFKVSILHA